MPLDITAAKKIINALNAHSRQPGGEIMERAAALLNEAVSDTAGAMGQIRSAEAATVDTKNKLEAALLDLRSARQSAALADSAIAALKIIAESKRGGNKLAQEWLVKNGLPVSIPTAPRAEVVS